MWLSERLVKVSESIQRHYWSIIGSDTGIRQMGDYRDEECSTGLALRAPSATETYLLAYTP